MKIRASYLSRRRFCGAMLGGGAAALGVTVAAPLVRYTANLRADPPPDFLEIAKAEHELAPGQSRLLLYGHIPTLLLRTPAPEAQLKVFVAVCTHFDCTVSYLPGENCIFCPCHEGRFDLEGRVTAGPPPAPLRTFHHGFKGDSLIIALQRENLAKGMAARET
jgi:Rieske Fe-S protein